MLHNILASVSVCVGMADCTTDTVNRLKRKLQEVVQNAPQVCSLHFSVVSPTSVRVITCIEKATFSYVQLPVRDPL